MIATRLKSYMSDLVDQCQCSFVPGRHGLDNIVIAQEIFHLMANMKGTKGGWMAIKVDLESLCLTP